MSPTSLSALAITGLLRPMTEHSGSKDRPCWPKTVSFWMDRPLSPLWTVIFGPDSLRGRRSPFCWKNLQWWLWKTFSYWLLKLNVEYFVILLNVCSFSLFDPPEVSKSENFEVSHRQLVSDRVHSWDGFPGNLNISVVMTFNVSLLRRSELELISWTLIGKFWKTHPENFPKFQFSGSWARPYHWKTHP